MATRPPQVRPTLHNPGTLPAHVPRERLRAARINEQQDARTGVMKQSTIQVLFGYWNEVRGERLAPRRFEIEPARIATILPETFILERLDSETFPYRLAGTKICDRASPSPHPSGALKPSL